MRLSVRNLGRYSYIVFASETVVFDDYGKPVIKCPTEAEAVEYIIQTAGMIVSTDAIKKVDAMLVRQLQIGEYDG